MTSTTRRIAVAVLAAGAAVGSAFGTTSSATTASKYTQCVANGGKGTGLVTKPVGNLGTTVPALKNLPSQAFQHTVCGLAEVGL